ncbi:MAG: hypothetical protein JWM09_426 [Francisellaceae bacterium]|nr:hypothetical protein [Francisellaceae bacterium]
MKKIVLATHNAGKIKEIENFFQEFSIEFLNAKELNLAIPEETGLSFVENALLKAREVAKLTQMPSIADDSGLIIPTLDNAPGLYSARYAGKFASAWDNINKLTSTLQTKNVNRVPAFYYCVIVLLKTFDDPTPVIIQGKCYGEILDTPQGAGGFGYDPLFYLPLHGCTMAELSLIIKNKISHRAKALLQLKQILNEYN